MSTDSINRVVFRALHSRRASVQDTQGFGDLQHNDHLCPQLQSRLDDLLSSCKRNFNVVYDVQGFRDSGVDVVIRVSRTEITSPFRSKQTTNSRHQIFSARLRHNTMMPKLGMARISFTITWFLAQT